jgi:pseudo-rSAM protein
MNSKRSYWLFLEPYVYVSLKDESVFLYNTLDGISIYSDHKDVIDLLLKIENTPEGVICINEDLLLNNEVLNEFILELRTKFMGDFIDVSLSVGKPVQLSPVLNLQNNIIRLKKDGDKSIGEEALNHLHEVLFFLESPDSFTNRFYPTTLSFKTTIHEMLNFNCIIDILKQLPENKMSFGVSIIMRDIFKYEKFNELLLLLNKKQINKKYFFHYINTMTELGVCTMSGENVYLNICVDFPIDEDRFKSTSEILGKANVNQEYLFLINSEEDLVMSEKIIERYGIQTYSFVPVYTGNNTDFFKKNVYADKEDIFAVPISMREIFIHQSLNVESFGKLSVIPGGDVYSNVFSEELGSIHKNSLLELVCQELDLNHSWFRVRNSTPCDKCHLQWLCPVPGNYEVLLKQNNLCHIN